MDPQAPIRIEHPRLEAFAVALLRAWGIEETHATTTAANLVAADLFAISSHGVHMLRVYERMIRDGRIVTVPQTSVEDADSPLIQVDAGGGLGHYASRISMQRAIAKARECGVAIASVRNSGHFGAAGLYALQAAEAGLVGLAMSSVAVTSLVPTNASRSWFGTNPIAFSAPSAKGHPHLLDMATTTSSVGRIMRAAENEQPLPPGWALDDTGRPTTDAQCALAERLLTPLGSTGTTSSYKGYGLAAMVEILSTFLSGSLWPPQRTQADTLDRIGHFFMALDPSRFRGPEAFASDIAAMHDALRASPTFDAHQRVLVPGDREFAAREARLNDGIPLSTVEHAGLRALAERAGIEASLSALEECPQ